MVVLAIGWFAATVWWLGLVAALGAILAVAYLAHQVTRHVLEIRRYAEDILEHGIGLAGALDPVPALGHTRDLAVTVAGAFRQLAGALPRIR